MQAGNSTAAVVGYFEGKGDGNPARPGLQPYIDFAGVATWGYGHALLHPVTKKQLRVSAFGRAEVLRLMPQAVQQLLGAPEGTDQQALDLLARDLAAFGGQVDGLVMGTKTTQGQFDAMTSLAFNVGVANFGSSTVLRRHRAGGQQPDKRDFDTLRRMSQAGQIDSMTTAFGAWAKADGKWSGGLWRRRMVEAMIYFGKPAQQAILQGSQLRY